MRKSGWAAATGLGSLVLLLAACGGSSGSSTSAAGAASSTAQAQASADGSGAASQATSAAASAAASSKAPATKGASSASSKPVAHHSAGPQPSSGTVSFPPVGTTIMVVQRSALGYVLAEANGQVVYTYSKDSKGGSPKCTGACADTWLAVTGVPKAGPADSFPGSFAVVKGASGQEQITYNGYPLYTFKGAKPLQTKGNNLDGDWHVVPLSESDINGA